MIIIRMAYREGDDGGPDEDYEDFANALADALADEVDGPPPDSTAFVRELSRYDRVAVTCKARADTLLTWLKTLPGSGCLRVKWIDETKRRR